MQRAVVSGAGGFIGAAMTARLRKAGVEVTTLSRRATARLDPSDPVTLAMGDAPWSAGAWSRVLDEARPDVVIHLAGVAKGSDQELEDANINSTLGLFAALRDHPGRPVVLLAGSAAEYGAAIIDGVPVTEDLPPRPAAAYGRSKLAQTRLAEQFMAETGRQVIVARIFNAIGPGMPGSLALGDFARQIARLAPGQEILFTGNLDVARDFLSGEQTAESIDQLVRSGFSGVVNVCSGVAVSLRRLVEQMIEESGRPIRLQVDPARLRAGDVSVIIGSTERLASLGAAPTPVDYDRLARSILRHELSPATRSGEATGPEIVH